jgi:hypothetical protein
MSDGLIHFLRVQPAVTYQFTGEQQYGNLVAVARPSLRLKIHVDDINGYAASRGQLPKLAQHLLAKAAPGAGIEQEPHVTLAAA